MILSLYSTQHYTCLHAAWWFYPPSPTYISEIGMSLSNLYFAHFFQLWKWWKSSIVWRASEPYIWCISFSYKFPIKCHAYASGVNIQALQVVFHIPLWSENGTSVAPPKKKSIKINMHRFIYRNHEKKSVFILGVNKATEREKGHLISMKW